MTNEKLKLLHGFIDIAIGKSFFTKQLIKRFIPIGDSWFRIIYFSFNKLIYRINKKKGKIDWWKIILKN